MLTCGTMSAFMNNVGAAAMLLPAVVTISQEKKVPVSKLLILLFWPLFPWVTPISEYLHGY